MVIGIDVDGVLTNQAEYQLKFGKKFFTKEYNIDVKNPKAYDIQEIFQCTREQREKFWKKYIWSYCLKEPMTKGAAQVIKTLRMQGHKIVIITGRAHTTEKGITGKLFRTMLKYWLWKNHLYYDDIAFCSESESAADKIQVCLEKKVNIMIDDKPENLFALRDLIEIVCYSAVWNEECKELDQYRINTFEDVYTWINAKANEVKR